MGKLVEIQVKKKYYSVKNSFVGRKNSKLKSSDLTLMNKTEAL